MQSTNTPTSTAVGTSPSGTTPTRLITLADLLILGGNVNDYFGSRAGSCDGTSAGTFEDTYSGASATLEEEATPEVCEAVH